jgi:hypothetical protein
MNNFLNIAIALMIIFMVSHCSLPENKHLSSGQIMRVMELGQPDNANGKYAITATDASTDMSPWAAGTVLRIACTTDTNMDMGTGALDASTDEFIIPNSAPLRVLVNADATEVALRAVGSAGECSVTPLTR